MNDDDEETSFTTTLSSTQTYDDSNGVFNADLATGFRGQYYKNAGMSDEDDSIYEEVSKASDARHVTLEMRGREKRFGFSVMGGTDEGFPPRIDEIAAGSPSDRADLEIGDEIVAVNGKNLEDCSHAEVINHIHKCIKTRTISLRVKRTGENSSVPEVHKIKDAYVIAVEEQARSRLEKLAAIHAINPVDMTKFSSLADTEYCSEPNEEELCENPIYTTANDLENEDREHSDREEQTTELNGQSDYIDTNDSGETTMNGIIEKEIPRKGKGGSQKRHEKKSSNVETPLIEAIMSQALYTQNGHTDSQNSLNKSKDSLTYSDNAMYGVEFVDYNGDGREMAIDCPDNFIATVKAPPRYPGQQNGNQTPTKAPSTPKDNGSRHGSGKNNTPAKPSREEFERLQKHQDDLHKRREEQMKVAQENEFLRTSLRGSKKLQALEKQRPQFGVINTAFDENEALFAPKDNVDSVSSASPSSSESKEKYMKKNIAIGDLFTSLNHIQSKLNNVDTREEVAFLSNLFRTTEFQHAVRIHNRVVEQMSRSPPIKPVSTSSHETAAEIVEHCEQSSNPVALQLAAILNKPDFKELLWAHDNVSEHTARPITELPNDAYVDYPLFSEQDVKIVHLEKTNEPLGATVRNDGESVIVGRIVKGGTAEKSGLLHEGDELLEVNGIDLRGKSIDDVSEMLANMTGRITFMVAPNKERDPETISSRNELEMIHMRAQYDYDPEEDAYIPCRELGLSFMKGDILHIINQEDANWWQAYREGEEEHQSLAGLVPSQAFQEQREALRQTIVADKENNKKSRMCSCSKKADKRKKRKGLYNSAVRQETDEILTYEEVGQYFPQPNRKRPIVLIGPPNIGRQELRERLMESDSDRFAAAVPHTSRAAQENETDGKDFHFVPHSMFEMEIRANKFVEHGEYKKALYGTSVDAIRHVVHEGKICVLNLNPESLSILKDSDLKPYIVFVCPPMMEKLRQIRLKLGGKTSDEELKSVIEKGRELEEMYAHYFDFILVIQDLDRSYDELLTEINRIDMEPQWVPLQWLDR